MLLTSCPPPPSSPGIATSWCLTDAIEAADEEEQDDDRDLSHWKKGKPTVASPSMAQVRSPMDLSLAHRRPTTPISRGLVQSTVPGEEEEGEER
jgi:hypothetical protein